MFSGHRATTFINTVLNSAYIRYVCGVQRLAVKSYHAGDDVYLSGTADNIESVFSKVLASRVRVNRSKQGLGTKVGEFLRVAFTADGARGYLARSIASLVSGNWVGETRASAAAAVQNYANQSWTLAVRSGVSKLPMLLVSTVCRRVPELAHYAADICGLRMSVNGSPVFDSPGSTLAILKVGDKKARRSKVGMGYHSYATDDFLNNYVSEELLNRARVERGALRKLMLEVSYKQAGDELEPTPKLEWFIVQCPKRSLYSVNVMRSLDVRAQTRDESHMAKLLGSLVGGIDWERIVRALVGDASPLASKLDPDTWPVTNDGTLDITELNAYRRRMLRPLCVNSAYPIRV